MYWARKLICVHVFDILFVVSHKWEVNCVKWNVTEKQFVEGMQETYRSSFNYHTGLEPAEWSWKQVAQIIEMGHVSTALTDTCWSD